MHILIIGGGGREHAIAWSLSRSPQKPHLFITPGNGGTTSIGENVSLDASDHAAVGTFVKTHSIDLVVIGPEQPLVDGLSDYLRDHDVAVVGPSAAAAQLEGSKAFSKAFYATAWNSYSRFRDLYLRAIGECSVLRSCRRSTHRRKSQRAGCGQGGDCM